MWTCDWRIFIAILLYETCTELCRVLGQTASVVLIVLWRAGCIIKGGNNKSDTDGKPRRVKTDNLSAGQIRPRDYFPCCHRFIFQSTTSPVSPSVLSYYKSDIVLPCLRMQDVVCWLWATGGWPFLRNWFCLPRSRGGDWTATGSSDQGVSEASLEPAWYIQRTSTERSNSLLYFMNHHTFGLNPCKTEMGHPRPNVATFQ
jgi:hypothetical protein